MMECYYMKETVMMTTLLGILQLMIMVMLYLVIKNRKGEVKK